MVSGAGTPAACSRPYEIALPIDTEQRATGGPDLDDSVGEGHGRSPDPNRSCRQRLVVSEAAVKTHINRIVARTGVRDRAQAVVYAYRTGVAVP